ncbi:putative ABC transport system ATP-binding protein [Desulfocicer vacuolatum DSM 3385]|uniref:Putative ABC transport system ATP-binding protein n=1 Tax=Desulfocicer vacuolatum DSM 3385 TaxID=1121400 RepID=A0A1W2DWC3_9BACT|nr:ABC transporter ATP-binding protein [Desulfocicer vacuolatum]SMD01855.1 putative ABC transport system ATP-binding protein [Desulfocicer vacuolatum DSM 3385]
MDIHFSKVTKSYNESGNRHLIFKEIDALFPSRTVSVIVGKSGVGKSSLLNLAGGIDTPDAGAITIGDTVITQMSDRDRTIFRRKKIGIIFQFFNLIPVLTVLENVCLTAELDKASPKEARENALSLLDQVGLYHRRATYPDTLSGGEQQRVAIVRALVHNPDIILADEPTGNLDMATGKTVLELIVNLVTQRQKTLIMVTHSPDAVDFAHRVFSFKDKNLSLSPEKGVLK